MTLDGGQLCEYDYPGMSTAVTTRYFDTDVSSPRLVAGQSCATGGSGADRYAGFDKLGRQKEHKIHLRAKTALSVMASIAFTLNSCAQDENEVFPPTTHEKKLIKMEMEAIKNVRESEEKSFIAKSKETYVAVCKVRLAGKPKPLAILVDGKPIDLNTSFERLCDLHSSSHAVSRLMYMNFELVALELPRKSGHEKLGLFGFSLG